MSNIQDFIKKVLIKYDEIVNENIDYINSDDVSINPTTNQIKINDKEFEYEELAVFEPKSKVWFWCWSIPVASPNDIVIAHGLLNYGIELQYMDEKEYIFFIKTLLINSRHYISNCFLLDILLAISSSLIKSKCKFIYPKRKKDGSTLYLLIK
jgi:hypothetical protein